MKRILYALTLLFLTAGIVHAGWNIKQNSDAGEGAVWTDGTDSVGVGGTYTATIQNVETAATAMIVFPRKGRITKIWGVQTSDFTTADASPVFTFFTESAATDNWFDALSDDGAAATMTMTTTDGAGGSISIGPFEANDVINAAGDVLIIVGGGEASAGDSDVTFTVILE